MPKNNKKKPAQHQTDNTEPGDSDQSGFPIVGIGASAGGLECFQNFFLAHAGQ